MKAISLVEGQGFREMLLWLGPNGVLDNRETDCPSRVGKTPQGEARDWAIDSDEGLAVLIQAATGVPAWFECQHLLQETLAIARTTPASRELPSSRCPRRAHTRFAAIECTNEPEWHRRGEWGQR